MAGLYPPEIGQVELHTSSNLRQKTKDASKIVYLLVLFKMTSSHAGTVESIKKLVDDLNNSPVPDNVEVVIAPAFIHLYQVLQSIKDPIKVSAQNCWSTPMGAYTGEVTVLMALPVAYHL